MGSRKSKGGPKKGKSKKYREKNNKANLSQKEKNNSQNLEYEHLEETISGDSVPDDNSDVYTDSSPSKASSDTSTETSSTDSINNTADISDSCEEIKAKQQELLGKIKNLSEALVDITLIRDNVNFLRVDTLTELYFTRQVRPLLDALNIISFASYNMSYTANTFQGNVFGDKNEVKNSLKLSYKMNDEVEDIINTLRRRLTIFLNTVDNMDKNCPPFDFGKDS